MKAPDRSSAIESAMPCSVCGRSFVPRFAYQTARAPDGATGYFCSVACRIGARGPAGEGPDAGVTCASCGRTFRIQYAFQLLEAGDQRVHVCSEACRVDARAKLAPAEGAGPRVIAVLNQKGGTGKTTTSVSLAAGLAADGFRVLLVDTDPQGSVAVSLGVRGTHGLYSVLVDGADPASVAVEARPSLWVVTTDRTLAAAELAMARSSERTRVMAERFEGVAGRFDYVLLDCAPSVSLIGQSALVYAQEVIVPVSCDYLALVGVKHVLRTIQYLNDALGHPVKVTGVVPTFFDRRNRICQQAVTALTSYFGPRLMPTIRVSTAFKEAPSLGRTIFEHAPKGRGAQDYRAAVDWLVAQGRPGVDPSPPATSFEPASVLTSEA